MFIEATGSVSRQSLLRYAGFGGFVGAGQELPR